MHIFLSHSNQQAPLVREIKDELPSHIKSWIDERDLLIGEGIETCIRTVIRENTDFLVVFVDQHAEKSIWVRKELEWALEREELIGRPFVLPIVIEEEAWTKLQPSHFKDRKVITCRDLTKPGVRLVASQLTDQLYSWLSRDLDRARSNPPPSNPKPSTAPNSALLKEADYYLHKVATAIRSALLPFRRDNPLPLTELLRILQERPDLDIADEWHLHELLVRLRQQGQLSGIVSHRDNIFIEEEHYSWKESLFTSEKARLARKAIEFIDTGHMVLLDAGSTTTEVAREIGRGLKRHFWAQLTVVTNSISVANTLAGAAGEIGLEDDNNILRLYLIGGRVRFNTQAVVKGETEEWEMPRMIRALGGRADIAFIGTNGIFAGAGFTTHDLTETQTKSTMLSLATRRIVISDPSKFGIRQQNVFATFDEGIEILTIDSEAVREYQKVLSETSTKILFA